MMPNTAVTSSFAVKKSAQRRRGWSPLRYTPTASWGAGEGAAPTIEEAHMAKNIMLISGDAHAGGKPEDYREYMEKLALDHYDEYLEDNASKMIEFARFTADDGAYSPSRTELVDRDNAIRSGGVDGAWDIKRRLVEMDREGIAGEVLFLGPQTAMEPFFTPSNRPTPLNVRAAGVRAFHRWTADHIADAEAQGRLKPTAETAGVDMSEIVRELQWCAGHGFGGIQLPGLCADPELPPLYDAWYEPFWAACAEAGLVLQLHAGWGLLAQGRKFRDAAMMPTAGDERAFRVEGRPRQAMWQMMAGGVFDRHPSLKLVMTEIRADWVPATVAVFDQRHGRGGTPMRLRPSEYFQRNCYVAPSSPRDYEVALRHQIGVDRFIFGRDYPHPEGTWPNTFEWIRHAFGGVPENEARLMLGENAIECYGFDRHKMAELAERIGPKPEDVLGRHPVDTALVEHFDLRSGYSKPPVVVDAEPLTAALDEDLVGIAVTAR
jgi:predicted TIM-barrel fold metal-dependent hydrolase